MKKILLIIVLSVVVSQAGIAQELSAYDFAVQWTDIRINGVLPLGATQQEVRNYFGEPDRVAEIEFFSYLVTVYRYGPNRFPFIDGRLTMLELKDNQFFVQIGDLTLRVGDSINGFAQHFPLNFEGTWTHRITGEKAVHLLYIRDNNGQTFIDDDYLVITRDNAGIITQIYEYGHY